jgi:hypothetical protein
MSHDRIVSDDNICGTVNYAIIFDAGVFTYGYLGNISPNDCSGPDASIFANFNIASDIGSLTHERGRCYLGILAIELSDHGLAL